MATPVAKVSVMYPTGASVPEKAKTFILRCADWPKWDYCFPHWQVVPSFVVIMLESSVHNLLVYSCIFRIPSFAERIDGTAEATSISLNHSSSDPHRPHASYPSSITSSITGINFLPAFTMKILLANSKNTKVTDRRHSRSMWTNLDSLTSSGAQRRVPLIEPLLAILRPYSRIFCGTFLLLRRNKLKKNTQNFWSFDHIVHAIITHTSRVLLESKRLVPRSSKADMAEDTFSMQYSSSVSFSIDSKH